MYYSTNLNTLVYVSSFVCLLCVCNFSLHLNSRLDVRKFSFSQRTINVWNKLSEECVHASSVNMFKNKIDK